MDVRCVQWGFFIFFFLLSDIIPLKASIFPFSSPLFLSSWLADLLTLLISQPDNEAGLMSRVSLFSPDQPL